MSSQRLLWGLRACWAALPLLVVSAATEALANRSDAVRLVSLGLGWSTWVLGLAGLTLAAPLTLTILRTTVPCAVAICIAVTAASGSFVALAGLVIVCVCTAIALSGWIGDLYVDGSSYGDERRFILRAPAAFLIGPIPVMWALTVSALWGSALLLAAGQLVAGIALAVAGLGLVVVSAKSFHALSKRWLVFVPAGMTLVDHLAIAEPVLFARSQVVSFDRATVGTDAFDLSSNALGTPLEIRVARPVEMAVMADREFADVQSHAAVMISPARAGAVLAEATQRALSTKV